MRHYKVKRSLRNKLLLAFILIGVLPTMVMGAIMYFSGMSEIEDSLINSTSDKISSVMQVMGESLYPNKYFTKEEAENYYSTLPFVKEITNEQVSNKEDYMNIPVYYGGGKIIVHLDEEYITNIVGTDKNSFVLAMTQKEIAEIDLETYIAVASEDSINGHHIVKIIDKDLYFQDTYLLQETMIKIILIVLVICICTAFGLSYNFAYGIDNLITQVKKVKKGKFEKFEQPDSEDEIAVLSDAFNDMIEEINNLINNTYKLQISEKNVKIKALQAQISPHFLYNALDSINWSLIENGDFQNSEVLIALSQMLRYSIDDSKSTVLLKEEFNQVENYLKIQKSRFEDRFEYKLNLDESARECKVPKMIIQPLVENAINHGLEGIHGGMLEVSATHCCGILSIEVFDTGSGMSHEKLQSLQARINSESTYTDEGEVHIGVVNVSNRIKYMYGNKSGMKISSEEGKFTIVNLFIETEEETE